MYLLDYIMIMFVTLLKCIYCTRLCMYSYKLVQDTCTPNTSPKFCVQLQHQKLYEVITSNNTLSLQFFYERYTIHT